MIGLGEEDMNVRVSYYHVALMCLITFLSGT